MTQAEAFQKVYDDLDLSSKLSHDENLGDYVIDLEALSELLVEHNYFTQITGEPDELITVRFHDLSNFTIERVDDDNEDNDLGYIVETSTHI